MRGALVTLGGFQIFHPAKATQNIMPPPCWRGVALRSNELGKTVYDGSCKWIRSNHPYHRNFTHAHFNNKVENKEKHKPLSSAELLEVATSYIKWLDEKGNRVGKNDDHSKQHGVKRMSCLYDLPYFEACHKENKQEIKNPIY